MLVIIEIFLLETLATRVILCKLASVTWRQLQIDKVIKGYVI